MLHYDELDEVKGNPLIQVAVFLSFGHVYETFIIIEEQKAHVLLQVMIDALLWLSQNEHGLDAEVEIACGFSVGKAILLAKEDSPYDSVDLVFRDLRSAVAADLNGRIDDEPNILSPQAVLGLAIGLHNGSLSRSVLHGSVEKSMHTLVEESMERVKELSTSASSRLSSLSTSRLFILQASVVLCGTATRLQHQERAWQILTLLAVELQKKVSLLMDG